MRTSHRLVLSLLCVAAFTSCSSADKADPTPGSTADGDTTADTTAGDTAVDTLPSIIDTTDLVVEAPPKPDPGSCVVSSVGAVNISFSSPGGPSAVSSGYWLPADVVSPVEPIALLATCTGVDGTVVSFSTESDVLQFAPGTYELRTDQVGVFLPDAILQPTGPVPMTLTQFDSARIVGSMVFDAASSDGATSNFRIDFDLANPTPG